MLVFAQVVHAALAPADRGTIAGQVIGAQVEAVEMLHWPLLLQVATGAVPVVPAAQLPWQVAPKLVELQGDQFALAPAGAVTVCGHVIGTQLAAVVTRHRPFEPHVATGAVPVVPAAQLP
jgi:hypothetical protein